MYRGIDPPFGDRPLDRGPQSLDERAGPIATAIVNVPMSPVRPLGSGFRDEATAPYRAMHQHPGSSDGRARARATSRRTLARHYRDSERLRIAEIARRPRGSTANTHARHAPEGSPPRARGGAIGGPALAVSTGFSRTIVLSSDEPVVGFEPPLVLARALAAALAGRLTSEAGPAPGSAAAGNDAR